MRLLVLAIGACLACSAQADSATDSYFRALDLNGDGYVSLSEAAGAKDDPLPERHPEAAGHRDQARHPGRRDSSQARRC